MALLGSLHRRGEQRRSPRKPRYFKLLDTSEPGYPSTGYGQGSVSGDWVAFNAAGNPASIGSAAGFNLYSGYFTAAWNDGLSVEVLGFRNGVQVYSTLLTLDPFTPTFINFGFVNVTLVSFVASGGVDAGLGSTGRQVAIDNLTVAATPIPAALPLLASALGGLGYLGWRRKRAEPR